MTTEISLLSPTVAKKPKTENNGPLPLPIDILGYFFSYVNSATLKSCTVVCKKWSSIATKVLTERHSQLFCKKLSFTPFQGLFKTHHSSQKVNFWKNEVYIMGDTKDLDGAELNVFSLEKKQLQRLSRITQPPTNAFEVSDRYIAFDVEVEEPDGLSNIKVFDRKTTLLVKTFSVLTDSDYLSEDKWHHFYLVKNWIILSDSIWNLDLNECIKTFDSKISAVHAQDKYLITASKSFISIWDLNTLAHLSIIENKHQSRVSYLYYFEGKIISQDVSISINDLDGLKCKIVSNKAQISSFFEIKNNSSKKELFSLHADGQIEKWNFSSSSDVLVPWLKPAGFPLEFGGVVGSVCFLFSEQGIRGFNCETKEIVFKYALGSELVKIDRVFIDLFRYQLAISLIQSGDHSHASYLEFLDFRGHSDEKTGGEEIKSLMLV